jgi:hypothetical protein
LDAVAGLLLHRHWLAYFHLSCDHRHETSQRRAVIQVRDVSEDCEMIKRAVGKQQIFCCDMQDNIFEIRIQKIFENIRGRPHYGETNFATTRFIVTVQ